jgi:SAM-dependent methyltransferase
MSAITSLEDPRFAFGENWKRFLAVVDEERILQAANQLTEMLGDLKGKAFLDVGCGSGIQSLAAVRLGASRVVSFDYDLQCVACTRELKRRFASSAHWDIQQGSALDESYMRSLGAFDIVYSWGVLHHTGDMWKALDLVTIPVRNKLMIAIYNDQGWQSRLWKTLKRRYVGSGKLVRKALELATFAIMWGGSLAYYTVKLRPWITISKWRNYSRNRGMSAWSDLVDWAGGYPFEVARPDELISFYRERGFEPHLFALTRRSGCNQFVFVSQASKQSS